MEQDIQNILQLVRSHAKSHKLKALKNFILRKYNQEEVLDSLEALEEYLRNRCDFEEETINEIYKILSQNFTNGSPYFVMEFNWRNNIDFTKLKDELSEVFILEEVIQPDKRKFQYLKRTTEFNFKKNNFLNFLIEFDSYKKRFSSGGLQEQGELQKSLEIEITFDFKYNLLIIKCGEQSYVNIIKKIFSQNLKSISFESLSIKPLVKQINFAGEANFHNQSYFILDFLFSKLRTNNFEANDYLAISFSNNKKEIKKTSVAGNNLFAEPTVEERLISLDAINAVKFQLAKIFVNQETGTSANLDEIRMDFRQQLKITFYKEQNDSYHRSYIHHIVTSLKEGLNGTHDCQNTEKLLKVIRS